MNSIYLLTKILGYPGAFMKGFWEHLACNALGLRVTDRHYMAASEFCGHAAHTPAMTPAKAFLLSLLPYTAQRILGWIFLGLSAPPLLLFGMRTQEDNPLLLLEYVALYLGLCLLCNSFPQWEDAKRHWRLFYGGPTPEEEQAMLEYSEILLATYDTAEDEAQEEAEEDAGEDGGGEDDEADDEEDEEDEDEDDDEEDDPDLPMPKFAGPLEKFLLAPCNAYFLAGAWLEKTGVSTLLALVITAAILLLR